MILTTNHPIHHYIKPAILNHISSLITSKLATELTSTELETTELIEYEIKRFSKCQNVDWTDGSYTRDIGLIAHNIFERVLLFGYPP